MKTGRCTCTYMTLLLAAVWLLSWTVGTAAAVRGPVFEASVPGAFGITYLPDRALVSSSAELPDAPDDESFTLSVHLDRLVKWVYLDRILLENDQFAWNQSEQKVTLQVPCGSHRIHLGWTDEPTLPPESGTIAVYHQDSRVGTLRAFFDFEGMEATGDLPIGPGSMIVSIVPAIDLEPGAVRVSSGTEAVDRWQKTQAGLVGQDPLLIDTNPTVTLNVKAAALSSEPVERIVITQVTPPAQVEKVPDEIPDGAILVEAENFSDSTGTAPGTTPGSHHDTHGGACAYSIRGDGSTLQWTFDVPEEGKYDLYARAACGDVGAYRIVRIDGETAGGLELVEMPRTSGWGHSDGEWWLVRMTGGDASAPSLRLDAGEHTVSFTGVLQHHLNLDYLLLVPAR
ncbi:MAG: hypothetical protein ACLFWB_07265 [Armatimonadota bacterium]